MKQKTSAPGHWQKHKPRRRAQAFSSILGPGGVRGSNFFVNDEVLRQLLKRHHPHLLYEQEDELTDFGSWVGSTVDSEAEYTATIAPPRLETYDRHGDLINRIIRNPHYSQCQRDIYRRGFIALNYGSHPAPHLLCFCLGHLVSQADPSLHISAALSATVAFVLGHHAPPDVRRHWLPGMLRTDGSALTGSLWTSERDDRCDLDQSTTRARKIGAEIGISGLKWFVGSPDCDLALVTARYDTETTAHRGPGLYLLPRRLSNGGLNRFRIRRLKDTVGTRGLATAEVELSDSRAQQVSQPPNGTTAIAAATTYFRLHISMTATAIQRRTLLECLDICSRDGGRRQHQSIQPMARDILLNLRREYEADMGLAYAAAAIFDQALDNPEQTPWQRLLTCLATYRSTRNAIAAGAQSMELFGRNGYSEDFIVTQLHRDALALRAWSGSGSRLALDLVPLMSKEFDLKERFGRTIRTIIDKAPLRASRLCAGLRKALAGYEEMARYLQHFPDAGGRLGFHLLELMADIFAAALLLLEASGDIERGDARKAMMLDDFLRQHFPDTGNRLRVRNSEHLKYFENLVSGTAIDVEGPWERALKPGL
jgi:alkylation response protein AidB-like acyl-CoA dehydrogenase